MVTWKRGDLGSFSIMVCDVHLPRPFDSVNVLEKVFVLVEGQIPVPYTPLTGYRIHAIRTPSRVIFLSRPLLSLR